jgi:hypothetical protein
MLLAIVVVGASRTAAAQESGLSGAIRRLAEERSQAEAAVSLLKKLEPDDLQGRALYAQAKAGFDGLIEQLLADLAQGQDPDVSPAFRASLDAAAAKRAAFGAHANAVVKAHLPAGARPAWLAAIAQIPGDLVKAVSDSGIAIWREWRGANAERRRDIAARVEAQRWKPWTDIPAAL